MYTLWELQNGKVDLFTPKETRNTVQNSMNSFQNLDMSIYTYIVIFTIVYRGHSRPLIFIFQTCTSAVTHLSYKVLKIYCLLLNIQTLVSFSSYWGLALRKSSCNVFSQVKRVKKLQRDFDSPILSYLLKCPNTKTHQKNCMTSMEYSLWFLRLVILNNKMAQVFNQCMQSKYFS